MSNNDLVVENICFNQRKKVWKELMFMFSILVECF